MTKKVDRDSAFSKALEEIMAVGTPYSNFLKFLTYNNIVYKKVGNTIVVEFEEDGTVKKEGV